jgi:tRNA(Ile)-lysidine synthase
VIDQAGFQQLPGEVALRLLGRAIAQVGDEGPVELGKLEALMAALARALAAPARFRRTLAGAMVTLGRGRLVIERAPARTNPPKTSSKRR